MNASKKIPLIGLIGLVAAGLGAFIFLGSSEDDIQNTDNIAANMVDTQSLAAHLSDTSTIGLLGIERPGDIIADILSYVDENRHRLPEEMRKDMPIPGPADRQKEWGIDPANTDSWTTIGIDPMGGIFITFDTSIGPDVSPIFLLTVTDRDALKNTLGSFGVPMVFTRVSEAVERVEIPSLGELLVGQKGAYTALLPLRGRTGTEGTDIHDAFAQFLKEPAQSLSQNDDAMTALKTATDTPRFLGLLNANASQTLTDKLGPRDRAPISFLANQIRALSTVFNRGGFAMHAITNTEGQSALKKMFEVTTPVNLAQYVPATGWVSSRISLNLDSFFVGASEWVPPSMVAERVAVASAAGILKQQGFDVDLAREGLSGHILLSARLSDIVKSATSSRPDLKTVSAFIALGVKSPRAADEWVASIISTLSQSFKIRCESVSIGAHRGWRIGPTQESVILVRANDAIFLAPSLRVIEAALLDAKGNNLSTTPAGKYLEDTRRFFAITQRIKDLLTPIALSSAKSEPQIAQGVMDWLDTQEVTHRIDVSAAIDNGCLLEIQGTGDGGAIGSMAVLGMMSAIAIPAFIKYVRRAKTSEATMNLRRAFTASVSYYHEQRADRTGAILPQQFPKSVETPPHDVWHASVCANGESKKFVPDENTWKHSTWQALNFSVDDPFFYKYTYESEGTGTGARFTIRATGDLNCDGVYSTFERIGFIDDEGNVGGGAGLYWDKELE